MSDQEAVGPPNLAGVPTGNPDKSRAGVGMPSILYLHIFGDLLNDAFDEVAYHVGSSLTKPTWRDVDVRIMLDKEKYAAMGLGDPQHPHQNKRWAAFSMAFSALGRQLTGLPIDFQLQETQTANEQFCRPDHQRSALIMCNLRRSQEQETT